MRRSSSTSSARTGVDRQQLLDLADRVHDRGVVAAAELAADLGQASAGSAAWRDTSPPGAAGRRRGRGAPTACRPCRMLKCSATRFWMSSIVTRRSLARSRSCSTSWAISRVIARPTRLAWATTRFSAPSSSRTLEVILWARNSSTLLRHLARRELLGLGLQDAEAQLVGRSGGCRRPGPSRGASAGAPPSPPGRTGDLSAEITTCRLLVDQGVEGVEELLLGRFLAADELDVVDHQHVDRAELLLEGHRVLVAQGPDELVHELFGRQVDHLARRACACGCARRWRASDGSCRARPRHRGTAG